jgi:hypothetical protein
MFEKTISGLFEMSGGDLRRFGASLARHKAEGYGLLSKYYAFSVSKEMDKKVVSAAVCRAQKHRQYREFAPGELYAQIEAGFYAQ